MSDSESELLIHEVETVETVDYSALSEFEINDDDKPDLTPEDIASFHFCNGCPFANEKKMKCEYDLYEQTGVNCYYDE